MTLRISSPRFTKHLDEWNAVFEAQYEREANENRGMPEGWRRVYVATAIDFFTALKVGFTGNVPARMWALSKHYQHVMECTFVTPAMPLKQARLVERSAHNILRSVWLKPAAWMRSIEGSSEWFLCYDEDAVSAVAFAFSQLPTMEFYPPLHGSPQAWAQMWLRPFRTKRLRGLEPWL